MTDTHFIPDELATRTARLINEAEDMRAQAVDDLKTIYGDLREELKALGWLGQNISKEVAAFKAAISEMSLDEEQKAKREEKGDRIDDYVALLSRSRAGARARTREGNAYAEAKLVETVAAGVQTDIGRAALIAAVDIMIEREEEEIATSAGGESEEVAKNAVASASGPDEKRATNSPEQAEFHAKASDDACEAGRKALGRAEASAEAPDGAELVSRGVADRAATATSENGRDSLERQAPSSTAKPKYALRPHCLNPGETCGGYGDKHCHGCLKAMREQAEEVA
ncbi:DUF2312 domain-containing protein [Sinorhizobium meliloti]|uniref:DUF2312 domain-containing protein n=1 Tax=Rhizobium meliloti TaxID=382 RepID=UPI000FD6BD83|nr:DUF2312 domain-containing protein [Sinorhizobium meliloti]RVJ93107.1 DUF2312 domain-containing protein [Sinorhizobium meliloti]